MVPAERVCKAVRVYLPIVIGGYLDNVTFAKTAEVRHN
jgi:hypothetical protein